jgi:hypothetical protein
MFERIDIPKSKNETGDKDASIGRICNELRRKKQINRELEELSAIDKLMKPISPRIQPRLNPSINEIRSQADIQLPINQSSSKPSLEMPFSTVPCTIKYEQNNLHRCYFSDIQPISQSRSWLCNVIGLIYKLWLFGLRPSNSFCMSCRFQLRDWISSPNFPVHFISQVSVEKIVQRGVTNSFDRTIILSLLLNRWDCKQESNRNPIVNSCCRGK